MVRGESLAHETRRDETRRDETRRDEAPGAWELAHVEADLGDDRLGAQQADAGDLVEALDDRQRLLPSDALASPRPAHSTESSAAACFMAM